jgi:hypothetical protein
MAIPLIIRLSVLSVFRWIIFSDKIAEERVNLSQERPDSVMSEPQLPFPPPAQRARQAQPSILQPQCRLKSPINHRRAITTRREITSRS